MKILLLPCLLIASTAVANNDCADRYVHCVRGEPVARTIGVDDAASRSAPVAAIDSDGVVHAAGDIATHHSSAPEPSPTYSAYPLVGQTTLDAAGNATSCVRTSTSTRCLPFDPNHTW